MNSINSMPVVEALSWTLIHFIWQGAAVALLLGVLKLALKSSNITLRYLISCAAMLAMLALPIITFATLYSDSANGSAGSPPLQSETANRYSVTRDLGNYSLISSTGATTSRWDLSGILSEFAPWLTSLWLAGVILLSLRMLGGWLYAQRLKSHLSGPLSDEWQLRFARLCHEIRVLQPVRILESALVQVPTVIGWLRPVVLIPASALMGLTARQLEAVIAHELAHIRRYDYLFNLLQTAVEILLFYHPAVWWVSREIRQERELCCDDVAVSVCGDPLVYARALTEIEALRNISPQLAMAADGGSLLARIQRLVGSPTKTSVQTPAWAAGAIVFSLVFGLAAGAQLLAGDTQASESATPRETPPQIAEAARPAAGILSLPDVKTQDTPRDGKDSSEEGESPVDSSPDEIPAVEPSFQAGTFNEEMSALGYSNLSIDDLEELRNHGVTPQLIRELKTHGFEKLSIQQLKRLASMGVNGQYIKELKAAGLDQLEVESLTRLASHGVNPALIRQLSDLGFKNLSADELARVAGHGVTPDFIRELESAGFKDLPLAEVVRARDHGVSTEFIKEIRDRGYDGLTLNQIIRLIDHGVNAAFIQTMEAAFGRLPLDELVRARDHGVDPDFAKEIQAEGYSNTTLEQLVRIRDHGVTPDYIKSIRKAGYDKLPIDQLIRMVDHGIDAEFIRRAKSHGFQDLPIEQLIRLRKADVLN